MGTRTSSFDGNGRIYVPAHIRREVDPGTEFSPQLVDGRLVFEPVGSE